MHRVSIVIPCYRGESTLPDLIQEIGRFVDGSQTSQGHLWQVAEVILVFDGGSIELREILAELSRRHTFVRVVWLSRNFGQHAATVAGISQSAGKWVVTMDEDGQHNPDGIGFFIDEAILTGANLVYGKPLNPPHHGPIRNLASRLAKVVAALLLGSERSGLYQSYRLIDGGVARQLAARVGPQVYLDVALEWFTSSPGLAPVTLRDASARKSGYSIRKLVSHFWRLIVSIGPRPMRFVSALGLSSALIGAGLAVFFFVQRVLGADLPEGWASQITVTLTSSGLILFSLGLVSEYLGSIVSVAQGRPPFVILDSNWPQEVMGRRSSSGQTISLGEEIGE